MQEVPTTVLALARYAHRTQRQEADVLVFDGEGMRLLANRAERLKIPYGELRRLRYVHHVQGRNRMWAMLGGALFANKDSFFRAEWEDQVIEIHLEQDIGFRQSELRVLFQALYLAGVPLEERHGGNHPMFLLEQVSETELKQRLSDLRSGQHDHR